MSRDVLRCDRQWFSRHPLAIVRFRRQHSGEFETLNSHGHEAPVFLPSFITTNKVNLSWVAVVDVFRMLQDVDASQDGTRLRLRVRTIPLRRRNHRAMASKELIQAVAEELLVQTQMDTEPNSGLDAA